MALEEKEVVSCSVNPDGQLQVLTRTIILKDGVEVASQNHRHIVDLDDDLENEAPLVQELSASIRTPERVAARVAEREATLAAMREELGIPELPEEAGPPE